MDGQMSSSVYPVWLSGGLKVQSFWMSHKFCSTVFGKEGQNQSQDQCGVDTGISKRAHVPSKISESHLIRSFFFANPTMSSSSQAIFRRDKNVKNLHRFDQIKTTSKLTVYNTYCTELCFCKPSKDNPNLSQ